MDGEEHLVCPRDYEVNLYQLRAALHQRAWVDGVKVVTNAVGSDIQFHFILDDRTPEERKYERRNNAKKVKKPFYGWEEVKE